jgi:Periplasmic protease
MKKFVLILFLTLGLQSCHEDINESSTPQNVFETLWTVLDQKYCFFDEKNVDWDKVHDRYAVKMDTISNSISLFRTLGEMICELKDGHVNLYASQDVIRYWKWFEDYAPNFNAVVEKKYLGTDYQISAGLKYKILKGDHVGYITYRSFSESISENGLDYIFNYFKECPGIILDVRDNSGGNLSNVAQLAARFTNKKIVGGYISHKTGPAHDAFSEPYPISIEPSDRTKYTSKPVIILTNRMCYSATNSFIGTMRQLPNVIIMGDRTGGGGGLPISSTLPNGWNVRFSSCPTYDADMTLNEEGIDPDIFASMSDEDVKNGYDTIIEMARQYIALHP